METAPLWILFRDKPKTIDCRKISEFGGYGDCGPVGDGVFELKFDFGPGYRVYFGIDRNEIVLLGGGDKSTQVADILKAKTRWEEYGAKADN